MDQRKKIIIGVAVAVALVIGLIWCLWKPSILVAEEPKFDIKDLNNMTPDDGSVLVAFQGYAKYLSDKYGNKRYLPLAPVTGVHMTREEKFQDVKFDTAVGSVYMRVQIDCNHKFYIDNITINTNDDDKDKPCHTLYVGISFEQNEHYECEKPLPPVACMRSERNQNGWDEVKVAELTISAIRLEINGNADDHRRGHFSNDALFCEIPSSVHLPAKAG